MTKIYACLVGKWVCLNDDPESKIYDLSKSPYLWWEEGAPIFSPNGKDEDTEHTFYTQPYVNVYHAGKKYRINPVFVQIVEE